jgi:hypothetical protein|tara:strand:+ start:154 stop:339 length:186 start_codon:yes stop_codon:yes gene_type:complete
MKTRNELLATIGKIEANIQLGQACLARINPELPQYTEYAVRNAKNNLTRIQELIAEIEQED